MINVENHTCTRCGIILIYNDTEHKNMHNNLKGKL